MSAEDAREFIRHFQLWLDSGDVRHLRRACATPASIDAILREKIAGVERRLIASGDRGDDATARQLLRKRTGLQRSLRNAISPPTS